jgi:hypothetical protein
MSKLLTRTLGAIAGAAATVVVTAAVALADYPPPTSKPQVKGKVVHPNTVAPGRALAFTGSDLLPLVAAVVVLLVVGTALLYWSRRARATS